MRTDVLLTIKETLEDAQNITVLSMNVEGNTVFGVYIREVRDNLSFLMLPKNHFETTVDGINIQFFELGTVLHNIYYNGALKFLDILYPDTDIMKGNSHYINLCNLIFENIPFNIAKLKYIEASNQKFSDNYKDDIERTLMLMDIANELNIFLALWGDTYLDPFVYVNEVKDKKDFVAACNSLDEFRQWLQNQTFAKISEKNMNRIDQMYINLQILHMEV
jgi:hypothetical protein